MQEQLLSYSSQTKKFRDKVPAWSMSKACFLVPRCHILTGSSQGRGGWECLLTSWINVLISPMQVLSLWHNHIKSVNQSSKSIITIYTGTWGKTQIFSLQQLLIQTLLLTSWSRTTRLPFKRSLRTQAQEAPPVSSPPSCPSLGHQTHPCPKASFTNTC